MTLTAVLDRAADGMDRAAALIARRWLGLFLLGLGVFVALPLAAPVLAARGQGQAAGAIYLAYRLTCHQLPHHSWFLFGPQHAYEWEAVQPYTGLPPDQPLRSFHHPLTDPAIGYQMAYCQRDTAIWGALFLTALALALLRRRRTLAPLPIKWYLLALVPMALDGITQLLGLRTSTPLLRSLTGGIFGAATALLVLPHLDAGFREVLVLQEMRRRGVEGGAEP